LWAQRAKELASKQAFLRKHFDRQLAELEQKRQTLMQESNEMQTLLKLEYADILEDAPDDIGCCSSSPKTTTSTTPTAVVSPKIKDDPPAKPTEGEEEAEKVPPRVEIKSEEGTTTITTSKAGISNLLLSSKDDALTASAEDMLFLWINNNAKKEVASPVAVVNDLTVTADRKQKEIVTTAALDTDHTIGISNAKRKREDTGGEVDKERDSAVFGEQAKNHIVVPTTKRPKPTEDGQQQQRAAAMASYVFFSAEFFPLVAARNPELDFETKVKLVGMEWQRLSAVDRRKYEDMARRDKERWEREKAAVEERHALAFRYFRLAKFSVLAAQHPNLPSEHILRMLQEEWDTLNGFQKDQFLDMAA